jgi:beta-galactosidase GanA
VLGKTKEMKRRFSSFGDAIDRPQSSRTAADTFSHEALTTSTSLSLSHQQIRYHYQRTHPAHWRDRMRRLSAMGVNAIQTYAMWNLHEPFRPGVYDFAGPYDIERFLDVAAEEGLWVLLRPGPYVCAEVDAGGLPWWLHDPSSGNGAGPELKARTADPAFLGFVDSWWGKLLPMMAPRMAVNGGNVLMVQMENEYGSFNSESRFFFLLLLRESEGERKRRKRKLTKNFWKKNPNSFVRHRHRGRVPPPPHLYRSHSFRGRRAVLHHGSSGSGAARVSSREGGADARGLRCVLSF